LIVGRGWYLVLAGRFSRTGWRRRRAPGSPRAGNGIAPPASGSATATNRSLQGPG